MLRARTVPRRRVPIFSKPARPASSPFGDRRPWNAPSFIPPSTTASPSRRANPPPAMQFFQNQPRTFARHRRPLDRHVIAVGIGDHAEPAFELRKVLVVLSEDERGMAIVVEGQGYLGGGVLARSSLEFLPHKRCRTIRWFQRGASRAARSGESRPNSELAPAETISARTISPMRSRLPSI